MELVTDFLFLGSKITADGDCSHETRCLLLGRKAMTNLDSMLKSRDMTLPTKVCIVRQWLSQWSCMVVSWTIKNAEWQRMNAFKLWCWRRLLKVPWTAKRSNQSILREINPENSLEGLMLRLNLQFWSSDVTDSSLEKSLMLGKIEGRRKRGCQRVRYLDGITNAMNMNLGQLGEMVRDRKAWRAAVHGVTKSWTQLGN